MPIAPVWAEHQVGGTAGMQTGNSLLSDYKMLSDRQLWGFVRTTNCPFVTTFVSLSEISSGQDSIYFINIVAKHLCFAKKTLYMSPDMQNGHTDI